MTGFASFLNSITIILVVIAIMIAVWSAVHYFNVFRVKHFAKFLSEDQFQSGLRKAQVIDLREANAFSNGHILGARNIPYSTFKNFYKELRPDLPVFLYDQTKTLSMRAANFLHKNGFTHIFILDEGYQKWNGKVKKQK